MPLRRPRLVLAFFATVVTASLVASFLLPKMYRSSTFILLESEKVPDQVVPRMAASEKAEHRSQTIRPEILSRTRLERVITETKPYPDAVGKVPMSDLVEWMRGATEITLRGNDAFSIDYVHRDPKKAAEVLNRLATLFIEETSLARSQQVEEAYSFLQTEVEEARRNLEAKEEAVRRYKESHLGTLPEQSTSNIAALQGLQLQEQALRNELRAAVERQGALEKQVADAGRGGVPTGAVGGDPMLEISQLKGQLASLRTRYTDEHPDVRQVLARLKLLQEALSGRQEPDKNAVDPVVLATQRQLEAATQQVSLLQEKRSDLERRIAAMEGRIETAPRTEQELATLTRDFANLRENYLSLVNRKLDAQMAAKLEEHWKGERFRILDPAHVPERPYFPNRVIFLAVGIVLGLLAGLTAAVVAEFLDHSFANVADVEATLSCPVLAAIPYIRPPRPAVRAPLS
ncbi:MAG TPA: GNVR domain-containing protein [Vicinamibacteria bacterium]|nr:GNVR domain-containing protein [Vicinamibacteria bacterium]